MRKDESKMDFIYTSKRKSPSSSMPKSHSHPYYELYYQISGERRYFIGDSIYDIYPGDIVFIKPYELHRTVSSNNKGFERYIINFNHNHIKELEKEIGEENLNEFLNLQCIRFTSKNAEKINNLIDIVNMENMSHDKYSNQFKQNLLSHIVLFSLRHGESKNQRTKDGADKIQDVAHYIKENCHLKITLHDASKLAFMEETYFSKKFKQLTGFGFNEYLTQIRLRKSESLLLSTKQTIGEIAEMCGFSSANYFGDIFKNCNGESPSQYRKRIMEIYNTKE